MITFGVDPGLASCGWGVVLRDGSRLTHVAHGCIVTAPDEGDEHERAVMVGAAVRSLMVDHGADMLAIERWVYYAGAATTQAHTLGLVLGAIRAAVVSTGLPVATTHRAQDWRTALGLSTGATKAAAQERVRVVLGLAKVARPQHASDALAVAIVARRP